MHRKEKKTKKMKGAAGGAEGERQEEEEEGEEEESMDDDETPGPSKQGAKIKTTKKNTKLKKRERKLKELRRDMYKVFDGSALMVIGTSSLLLFLIISPPYRRS